jgi:cephalosporin hydroxylase
MKLAELGRKYGTDKAGPHVHTFKGFCFLDVYERHLSYLQYENVNFLELGILNGSSLKMWEEYFTNGNIIGLDIDPTKMRYTTDRTKIYVGSQSDELLINKIKSDYPNGFDVVLDDASHLNELTITSFNLLFNHLKPGGYYIIEDTHCTYGGDGFADGAKKWPGMNYNDNSVNFDNNRNDFNQFIFEKIKQLDFQSGEIFSIHFYSETIVIEKA